MTTLQPPKSQAEFDAVMREIDERLRQKNVQIHARVGHAAIEYSALYKLEFPMCQVGNAGTPGNYADATVDSHIQAWFDAKYGERQKVHAGPGTTVLLIRGDPWEVRLPLIYGEVELVVERDLERYKDQPSIGLRGQRPIVNILSAVRDLPQGLAAQLTDTECRDILHTFEDTLDCMYMIGNLYGKPYIAEVRADVVASVSHLFSLPPHFGQSKWASSQATEKLLKCLLTERGVSFPKIHNLEELASLARLQGARIDSAVIAHAATAAGVRYGEGIVSLADAVTAHYVSLLTARQVHEALEQRNS